MKTRAEIFLAAADAELESNSSGAAPGSDIRSSLGPLIETVGAIRQVNERAMTAADLRTRAAAARSRSVMLLTILAALPLGLFFAFRLNRRILRPIEKLTESARALGDGNLDQVIPIQSKDELGQLATAFNKMAGSLRQYRQTTAGEILRARQATEATFAALPDPIVVFSGDGTIAYENDAAAQLRRKVSGSESPLPVVPLAMKVLEGGADYLPDSFDKAICVRIDDRERFLLPRVIGFRDGTGAVVILQDVTRFRLLDDVKTNLVATVSHELKTPLTSIRMAVHLLLEERIGALNAKQTELLLASRDDAERLLDLINNLLNLARLESGASAAERVVCQPDQLVRNAVAQASDLVTGGVTQIVAETDPNLPPVVISPDQIAHVFANLISNAIKHSPPGEQIFVTARRQKEDAGIRFSVIDHGDGVPVSERERIFEKFYRVPGEQREGAGLGLAIAREIIKAHHGRIGVVDAPGGRGSEFFFVLPMQHAGSPAEVAPALVTP